MTPRPQPVAPPFHTPVPAYANTRGRRLWPAALAALAFLALPATGAGQQPPPEPMLREQVMEQPRRRAGDERLLQAMALYVQARLRLRAGQSYRALDLLRRAAALAPASGRILLDMASILLRQGKTDEAMVQAKKAVKANPRLVAAWLILAGVHGSRKEVAPAIEAYRKALKLNPNRHEARLLLGTLYYEDGRMEEALEQFRLLTQKRPGSVLAYHYMGQVLVNMGRYAEAEESFQHAIELSPRFIASQLQLGSLYEKLKRYGQAERIYRRILAARPQSNQAKERLGRMLLRTGRRAEARRLFMGLKGTKSDGRQIDLKIGLIYFQQGQYQKACTHFGNMAETWPMHPRVRFYQGLSCYRAEKWALALAAFDAVASGSKFYFDAQLSRVEILQKQKKFPQALALIKDLINKHPGQANLKSALAALYENEGRLKEAEAAARKAIGEHPDVAELYFRLGVILDKQKRRPLALAEMERALSLDPKHFQALNYVGYCLAEEGRDLEKAERYIRRALAQRPDAGYILDSLGWVYFQRGQYRQAYVYLERAVAAGGVDPIIFEHLGDAARKLGRLKRALWAYQQALKRKHKKQQEIRRKLDEIKGQLKSTQPGGQP